MDGNGVPTENGKPFEKEISRLADFPLGVSSLAGETPEIRYRVEIVYKKFVAPLNLLYLIPGRYISRSRWFSIQEGPGMNLSRLRELLQNSVVTIVLLYLIIIILTLLFSSSILGGLDPESISDNRTLMALFMTIPDYYPGCSFLQCVLSADEDEKPAQQLSLQAEAGSSHPVDCYSGFSSPDCPFPAVYGYGL